MAELELGAAKESTRYMKILVTQRKVTDLTNSMRMQNFIVTYLDKYLLTADSGLEEVLRGRRTQAIGALRMVLGVVVICETGNIVAKLIETVNASGEAKTGKDGVTVEAKITNESVRRTETSGTCTVGMGLKLIKLQKKVGSCNVDISFARANNLNSKALEDAQVGPATQAAVGFRRPSAKCFTLRLPSTPLRCLMVTPMTEKPM